MPVKYNGIDEMFESCKRLLVSYIIQNTDNQELVNNINQNIESLKIFEATGEDFYKTAGVSEKSDNIPAGFYDSNNHKIYIHKKNVYSGRDIHIFMHELIHATSRFLKEEKLGLEQFYYIDGRKDFTGATINEAATEYITSSILNDSYGYTEDMKTTLQLFLCMLNKNEKDLINMYFSKECWINEENGFLFNQDEPYLFSDLVQEYDKRLPKNNHGKFDKEKFISNLYENLMYKYNKAYDIDYIHVKDLLAEIVNYWYIGVSIEVPSRIIQLKNMTNEIIPSLKKG